jgi:hypothetical protein
MLETLLSAVIDGLYRLPPVRFLMGLVNERWRPIWAAVWLVALVHVVLRVLRAIGEHRARRVVVQDTLTPAPQAAGPTTAPAPTQPAPVRSPRASLVVGELVTRVPPRVLAAIVGVAAVVAVSAALMLRPATAMNAAPVELPEAPAVPAAPVDDTPFAFRSRGSRADDDDCLMTFESTAGTPAPWSITADVMDSSGTVIARDAKRVTSLLPGLLVEFRFKHVDCDEIESWQFQGETRKRR